MFGFVLLAFLAGTSALQAQTKQLVTWVDDLRYLQKASSDEKMQNKAAVMQIRDGVELWLKLRPESKVELASAPPQPWGAEQLAKQITELLKASEAILKEDPDQPFNLGMTTVSVAVEASALSPVTDSIDRTEIVNRQAVTVAAAIDYMPGLALDHGATRNEMGVRLRGFSNRGQVPLYLDGIPIQVPYDGTIDFSRFLTSDIAEVQVAKGFSSPLLGPNALGGSINLVTRQPEKKFESDALIGTGSGNQLLSSLHLGSRFQHFYVQGSVDWLQRDSFPLSGNFPLQTPATPSNRYQTTYDRNLSDSRDEKYSARIAWTPKSADQYIFSYTNQKGEKGQPLYAGPNLNASLRYWTWPFWNKNSYYFISNTALSESSSIKFRLFYDQFRNALNMYDNDTYTIMKNSNSGISTYDDHTGGAASEFFTRFVPRNAISASFFFKDDTHKEFSNYPGRAVPFTTPTLLDRSQQFSIGFQDAITLTSRLSVTFGFSADYLKGLRAMQFNSASTGTIPFTCFSNLTNTSFSGCTEHVWNHNPQASLSYHVTNLDTFFFTFADRGRFPLLKDTYSYKNGTSFPNPDLKPEHSRNWTAGYSHSFTPRTQAQIEYFRSDVRDAIQPVYIPDPNKLCTNNKGLYAGLCSLYTNVAKEIHEGTEFSIRSTPVSHLLLDASYSYLNRSIAWDFAKVPNANAAATSTQALTFSALPKNKVMLNATLELPHKVLAIANYRYEGGIFLQDTTYTPAAPQYAGSYGTVDLGTVAPIYAGFSLQVGLKNLFDRNYYYTAGYPEAGRTWYFNGRYRF
jgi:iron complex outermembrane recepter protein